MCLAIFALLSSVAGAQTSTHQRLGVEREVGFELSPSFNLGLSQDTEGRELSLEPTLGLELRIAKSFSISLDLPGLAMLPLERSPSLPARAAVGDPSIALGYSFRSGDWRLSGEAFYRHPFGVFSPYEVAMKSLRSGSGYRSLGVSLAATRFLDPLVLGARLTGSSGLPRPERFGESFRPLDLGLALFATEALNDAVALSAALDMGLDLPRVLNGVPSAQGRSFELSASAGIALSLGDSDLRLSLAFPLSDRSLPARTSFAFAHSFRSRASTD